MENNLIVFTDGGSRGNPGPAAAGVVIKDKEERVINQFGKTIGETTNNVAEYTAVIEALRWIKENTKDISSITFFLDSKLVVNQVKGLYKINESHLRDLLIKVHELEAELDSQISYNLIPREKNKLADLMVNQALDNR